MTLNTAFLLMAQYGGHSDHSAGGCAPGLLFTSDGGENASEGGLGRITAPGCPYRAQPEEREERFICKTWWTTSISDARRRLRSRWLSAHWL